MFITIEGIDGSGKSTFAVRAVEVLQRLGHKTLWTREPGGWPNGDQLRSLLLNAELKNGLTEVMLFLADRLEHVSQIIAPALRDGVTVVCERYNDSTRAYQCWGRTLNRQKLESLLDWCSFPVPDLTVWLDLPVQSAAQRMVSRGNGNDRIESESFDFHKRVSAGFLALSHEYCERFVRFDAEKTPDQLARDFETLVKSRTSQP